MNSTPLRLLGKLAAPSVLAVFAFGLPQAHAVSFDFSTSTQFTDNFYRPTGTVSVVSQQLSASGTTVWIYDTAPNATPTTFFSSVSVDFDFHLGSNGSSVGVYFGGTNRSNAALALLNINSSGSTDTIRFSSSANAVMTSGGAGTLVAGNSLSSGGYTTGTGANYHANLTVTYLTATTAQATFTISDPSFVLTAFSATSGVFAVAGPGEIGFRSYSATIDTPNTFDNIVITAIPEPSTWALFGGAGAFGFALVLRRKRR